AASADGDRGGDGRQRPSQPHHNAVVRADPDAPLRRDRRPLLPAGRPGRPHRQTGRPGVIYTLRHATTYVYEDPVTFARCVLRLTPKDSAGQEVLRSSVQVTSRPASTVEGQGPFGERTLTLIIDRPHTELVIEARSRVDVHASPVGNPAASPPWEAVHAAGYAAADLGP